MSTIKSFTVGNDKVEIYCSSRNTRSGFAHDAELFINGNSYPKSTCHYINRTWECYTFQSVIQKALSDVIQRKEEFIVNELKKKNNWSKITPTRKQEVEVVINADERITNLKKILCYVQGYTSLNSSFDDYLESN